MPRNKIHDLRNHLFEQLERLNDDELSNENLDKEIHRAKAMSELAKNIVESAKVEVHYLRITGQNPSNFISSEKQLPHRNEDDYLPQG